MLPAREDDLWSATTPPAHGFWTTVALTAGVLSTIAIILFIALALAATAGAAGGCGGG